MQLSMTRIAVGALAFILGLAAAAGVAAAGETEGVTDGVKAEQQSPSARLLALSDTFMARYVEGSAYLKMLSGERVTSMPGNSAAAAASLADFATDLQRELASIDRRALTHDDRLTYDMLEGQLAIAVEGEQFFWHRFNVTPYAVGLVFNSVVPAVLGTAALANDDDVDAYLAFLQDIARYVEDDLARLRGQAERGIRLPRAALPGARTALGGIKEIIDASTALEEARLASLDGAQRARLEAGVAEAVSERIEPALAALLTYLGPEYVALAPESVGLHQYPNGKAAYRFAVRRETTLDLDPEAIHEQGLAYMEEIQAGLAAIRQELGFEGSQQDFHEALWSDPRFFASTPAEVAERYRTYIRRIEPLLPDYFAMLPEAPYDVKRLDPSAEPGMTFGFYQAPTEADPVGYYRFNGSRLESRPMIWTAALIYHELVPGHHFHVALQREKAGSSRFRAMTSFMYAAYTEGWANYAASLAGDMGILDDPYERYGWLLFDAFITNRLVVDTGMNYFGWPLEKARAYMKANTFSSDEEINSETLRYATDLPAQALAYKLGYEKMLAIRSAQRSKRGDAFDIREFHAAMIGSGAMPLPLLERHVDWYLDQ